MPDSVAAELRERLHQVLQAVRRLKAQPAPVAPGLVSVLGAIDGCHLKDLAERNALDPSTVSRAVTTLVQHGLVRRTADPADGRASILRLTESGEATLRDTHDRYDALLAQALSGWSAADLATFCALLERFAGDLSIATNPTLEAAR